MLVTVYVDAVALLMLEKLVLSVDDCHCTFPVFPESVSTVLLASGHTVAAPAIEPATDAAFTVTVRVAAALAQPPEPLTV
jgi:hypothetical protein